MTQMCLFLTLVLLVTRFVYFLYLLLQITKKPTSMRNIFTSSINDYPTKLRGELFRYYPEAVKLANNSIQLRL